MAAVAPKKHAIAMTMIHSGLRIVRGLSAAASSFAEALTSSVAKGGVAVAFATSTVGDEFIASVPSSWCSGHDAAIGLRCDFRALRGAFQS
jgi:hypothetical protein